LLTEPTYRYHSTCQASKSSIFLPFFGKMACFRVILM
jgi:hypothetical protein